MRTRVDLTPKQLTGGAHGYAGHLAAQALLGTRRVELDLLLSGRQDARAFRACRALGLLDAVAMIGIGFALFFTFANPFLSAVQAAH